MNPKSDIPVLIDFDGVIRIGENPAKDLKEFISFIQTENVPAIIVSNSTLKSSEKIKDFFTEINLEVSIPIITAVDAALTYVKDNYKKVSVFCTEEIKNLFI